MRFSGNPILWALMALLVLCSPSASEAEIVRLRLTGKVSISASEDLLPPDLVAGADTNVLEPPDPDAPGGKRFVAYWSYDTSVPDAEPELPYSGVYHHPLADPFTANYGLTVVIDDYVFRLDTAAEPYTVGVVAGGLVPSGTLSGGAGDAIRTNQTDVLVSFQYNTPQTINDRIILSIADSLFSTAADSSLSSDALPTSLDVTEFDLGRIQIDGVGEVTVGSTPPPSFFIQAWIHEITVVPEPSAVCILLLSAPMFFWRFRR
jgi:hypothetical protein